MKKISLLLVLALVLTVGGVYAAWVYPLMDEININNSEDINVTIDAASQIGDAGAFSFENTGVAFKFENDGNYNTVLTAVDPDAKLVIKFTPSAGSGEVGDIALPAYLYGTSSLGGYADVDELVEFNVAYHTIGTVGSGEEIEWVADGNGAFTFEITAAELVAEHLTHNSVCLDTYNEHYAFSQAIAGKGIVIHISTIQPGA